jgi:hypothetical protein
MSRKKVDSSALIKIRELNSKAQKLLERVPKSVTEWSGDTLKKINDSGRLDLKPWFQRGDVWSTDTRAKLVDSFLTNTPIPPVYLEYYKVEEGVYHYYKVIDGKQRITSLTKFINNEFPLSYEGQSSESPFVGKYYKNSHALQTRFEENSKIPIIILDLTTLNQEERKILEQYVFQRWNDQNALKPAEYRHSFDSPINAIINDDLLEFVIEKNQILDKSNNRKEVNEILERMLFRLYKSDEISHQHATATDLKSFHYQPLDTEKLIKCKKEIITVLKTMGDNKIISQTKKLIKINHKLDLFYLLASVRRNYGPTIFDGVAQNLMNKFVEVIQNYKELDSDKDKRPLSDKEINFMNHHQKLFEYYRGGQNGTNALRFHFWMEELKKIIPSSPLDPNRLFDRETKELLWVKQNTKCLECGKEIDLNEAEAHHKEFFSLGNTTSKENGEILCINCHDLKHTTKPKLKI